MNEAELREVLQRFRRGELNEDETLAALGDSQVADLGYATLDLSRARRQGVPEVIYGRSKTDEQILGIVDRFHELGARDILITGMSQNAAELVGQRYDLEYHALPELGIVNRDREKARVGSIVVVSGGTSDMAVCEEAALTAEVLGNRVSRIYDVGVAGLHRLLRRVDELRAARVIIAVAGMEGALPSVVGGLVAAPVVAVPTSVGYGANMGGLTALHAMLNSCASGIAVVNIDNGFGAAFMASRINQMPGLEAVHGD